MRPVAALLTLILALLSDPPPTYGEASTTNALQWVEIEPGYSLLRYNLTNPGALLTSPVVLVRFDPERFIFQAISAQALNRTQADVESMVEHELGFAGINANFFDTSGAALGLVVDQGTVKNRLHAGGAALTGILLQDRLGLRIIHRSEYRSPDGILFAVQAGPRLVADGKPLPIEGAHTTSRRSGCAVTRSGELILFATVLRFPGATLAEIQKLLLSPELDIRDALNFDGGGSSQLFLSRAESGKEPLLISGGDTIPVALVISRRKTTSSGSTR